MLPWARFPIWEEFASCMFFFYSELISFYLIVINNIGTLTLSPLKTKAYLFANSIDPDEMIHNQPSHQDLHYLQFLFIYLFV